MAQLSTGNSNPYELEWAWTSQSSPIEDEKRGKTRADESMNGDYLDRIFFKPCL